VLPAPGEDLKDLVNKLATIYSGLYIYQEKKKKEEKKSKAMQEEVFR